MIAATDSDGGAVCVARGYHGGELCIGKGLVRHGKCHVSFDGKEHVLTSFDVLINDGGFVWQHASGGQVPHNAGENFLVYIKNEINEILIELF